MTIKNVDPAKDALLLIAYKMQPRADSPDFASPTVVDLTVLSMVELVEARDTRLKEFGGRWFGDYETPAILSKLGKEKVSKGIKLDTASYGRKESEGRDFNEDTNFGKLKRIPHAQLQAFLAKHRLVGSSDTPHLLPSQVD